MKYDFNHNKGCEDYVWFRKNITRKGGCEDKEIVRIANRGGGVFEMSVESAENTTDQPQLLAEAIGAWTRDYGVRIKTMAFVDSEKYDNTGSIIIVTELQDDSERKKKKE